MSRASLRLMMVILWLALACYLVLAADWSRSRTLGALLAVLFGGYNLLRWWLERDPIKHTPPPTDPLPYESRNPDFDFEMRTKELDERP